MEQHILAYLAESGPAGWAFVSRTMSERHPGRPAPSYTIVSELEKRGFVARTITEETPNVVFSITDAGREHLAKFPPPQEVQRGPWLMTEHSSSRPAPEPEKKTKRRKK